MRLRVSTRMFGRWLKRQTPKSLFGRSLLIIVLPVALMQIAVTWIFFDAHWETVTSRLSDGLAGEVAWAVESYQDDPSPSAFATLAERAEESLSLSIALQPGRTLPLNRRASLFAPIDRSCSAPCRRGWTRPSGSTRRAIPPTSTSASRWTRASCASWPRATAPLRLRATSSSSG